MSEDTEAKNILALCGGDGLRAFQLVEGQLATLVLRAQVMLSLSGIVITVTGFSGSAIATTSLLAQVCIVAGLLLVLMAAAVAVGGVLKLRWLTQDIGPQPIDVLILGIGMRDKKARALNLALGIFVTGFALYCLAVAQLLAVAR